MQAAVSQSSFFFAITSINITHMLITYFYLNKEEVPTANKKVRAGRKQFKQFAKLNVFSKRTFYELHAFTLIYLFKLWQQQYKKAQPRMPNFNELLNNTKLELH